MDAKEVGAALALVGKRLECKPVDDAVDMDMVEDIYTMLERLSAEWVRETKRECWEEVLKEMEVPKFTGEKEIKYGML